MIVSKSHAAAWWITWILSWKEVTCSANPPDKKLTLIHLSLATDECDSYSVLVTHIVLHSMPKHLWIEFSSMNVPIKSITVLKAFMWFFSRGCDGDWGNAGS